MTSIERRELQQRDKSGRARTVVRYKSGTATGQAGRTARPSGVWSTLSGVGRRLSWS